MLASLSKAAINSQALVDWDGFTFANLTEVYVSVECDGCGDSLVMSPGIQSHTDCHLTDPGFLRLERPNCSEIYPIPEPIDPEEAAATLHALPLAVVTLIDVDLYAITLTDHMFGDEWLVCQGYLLLGYLPPIAHCSLLAASPFQRPKTREVLQACAASVQVARSELADRADQLTNQLRRL